jgi:endonuclease/exonuclease/phosphatase family metal-dependent hydrolase
MNAHRIGLLIALLVVMLGAAIFWVSSTRLPTGNASGSATHAMSTTAPSTLRVAAFNIHSGIGRDDKLDLSRAAKLLRGYDLICLNEVRPGQTEELSELLHLTGLFAPTEQRYFRDSFGSAALFEQSIPNWTRTQLPGPEDGPFRNMIQFSIPFGAETLSVIFTHVGRDEETEPQLKAVTEAFLALKPPALLAGDLNLQPQDPLLRPLIRAPGVTDPLTRRRLTKRLEHILLRGVAWMDAGLVKNDASDHPLVWVEIKAK